MALRPLAPKSAATYDRLLFRAFGPERQLDAALLRPEVANWPNSVKYLLRSAIARRASEQKINPSPLIELVQPTYEAKRVVQGPTEDETSLWEQWAAREPRGKRAALLLLPALGLRANELLTITRASAEDAVRSGELRILRKRGKEALLPAQHVRHLLEEMLETPGAPKRKRLNEATPVAPVAAGRPWRVAGELFAAGQTLAQYHALRDAVVRVGRAAGIRKHMRPHLLRHAFATRAKRDGMPDLAIQAMMGHSSFVTTARYLHAELTSAAKYLRAAQLA